MEWLRLYSNIVNDPKIMQMPERFRWRYIALLCLFRINNDSMPSDSDIIFSMRIKKTEWNLTKNEFEKRGILTDNIINGWSNRQYKSDNGYERVKRFRNKKETLQEPKKTVTVTPPEQKQNRTEKELKEKFEIFRKVYPGTKRGLDVEYDNLQNCCKKHKLKISEIVLLLKPAIERRIKAINRILSNNQNAFIPVPKNLKTWINEQCWTEEIPIEEGKW